MFQASGSLAKGQECWKNCVAASQAGARERLGRDWDPGKKLGDGISSAPRQLTTVWEVFSCVHPLPATGALLRSVRIPALRHLSDVLEAKLPATSELKKVRHDGNVHRHVAS